jgi:carboxypeptidase Q
MLKNFMQFFTKKTKCLILLCVFCTLSIGFLHAQTVQKEHTEFVKQCFSKALADGRSYAWLNSLCNDVGHRLTGSAGAEMAISWAASVLDTLHLDTVWLQPMIAPYWNRGGPEEIVVTNFNNKKEKRQLNALALGGSVGTDGNVIEAPVVEAKSWSDLERLGRAGIEGKIVLFNRPMDPTKFRSFEAYGGAVDQRVSGASKAAAYGAVAVLVRSMTQQHDDLPHTGSLRYDSAGVQIPAVAISTNDADWLSAQIRQSPKLRVSVRLHCFNGPETLTYNVIGELRGREFPNEYLLVGGHLDSWDVGEGAHDDGAGCTQSMEVLRLLQRSGYRPRHGIRCVLFMNEENGLRGGLTYVYEAEKKEEIHRCAIETDAGGFTPRGFTFTAADEHFEGLFEQVKTLRPYFEPYNMTLNPGSGGADIGPLKSQGTLLCGYYPDSQRYFDFHHTAADVFEAVNQRELELGAASMTALIYLLDQLNW